VRGALDTRRKIADLVEEWRKDRKHRLSVATQDEYERAIEHFTAWCAGRVLAAFEEVDRATARQFVEETYEGRKGSTVQTALSALNNVWKHATRLG
jgi:site-specific recombinase XerD